MSRSRRGWIVAIRYNFPGPAGTLISDFHARTHSRILKRIERQRELGGIPDEELVLEEYAALKTLDPKEWKDQDHYAVLGLPTLRHRATQEQIKLAYRKAVLKHHPDKRRRKGEDCMNDSDDYFTCITRANEVLGTVDSRRSYDSIDPQFNNDIPPKTLRENFFETYNEVFERNSRWSVEPDVPFLGDEWSTVEEVDRFYDFWYNFNSWREYSYLDEENKEKAEDAYERRWMEKQNRAARATRKKEENQRIRQLVDNAYACDPRIKRYKEAEKKKKEAGKAAKAEAIRKANDQRLAEERKVQLQREEEEKKVEEERRLKQAEAKKEREKEKKLLKKERQKLKNFCEENNYFSENKATRLEFIDSLNHLCVSLDLLQLQRLNKKISSSSKTEGKSHVEEELSKLREKVNEEKQKHLSAAAGRMKNGSGTTQSKSDANWPYEDLQMLIKAVNLFPAGTANRWDVVAQYLNTHSCSKTRTSKECLGRAKNLKESELKAEANQKAFEKFREKHTAETERASPSDGKITTRFDAPRPWTSEEQKRLEQALKTYPASTDKRWDKIAESITDRSKKECILRYKELVEMVKAKKAVSQNAKKS